MVIRRYLFLLALFLVKKSFIILHIICSLLWLAKKEHFEFCQIVWELQPGAFLSLLGWFRRLFHGGVLEFWPFCPNSYYNDEAGHMPWLCIEVVRFTGSNIAKWCKNYQQLLAKGSWEAPPFVDEAMFGTLCIILHCILQQLTPWNWLFHFRQIILDLQPGVLVTFQLAGVLWGVVSLCSGLKSTILFLIFQ